MWSGPAPGCLQTVPIAVQGPGVCTQGQILPLLTLCAGVLGVVQWLRSRKGVEGQAVADCLCCAGSVMQFVVMLQWLWDQDSTLHRAGQEVGAGRVSSTTMTTASPQVTLATYILNSEASVLTIFSVLSVTCLFREVMSEQGGLAVQTGLVVLAM